MLRHGKLRVVRTQTRTAGSPGEISHRVVYCQRRERSVPVSECLCCPRGGGTEREDGRELVRCAWDEPTDGDPPIGELMDHAVLCVHPSMSAGALVSLLVDAKIGGAPVVDRDGKAVGVVSKADALL